MFEKKKKFAAFISEIDRSLAEFDKQQGRRSNQQIAEREKYKRIHTLRDTTTSA